MSAEKHLLVTHKRPQVSDLLYIYQVKKFATEATHHGVSNGVEVLFIDNDKDLKDEDGNSLVPFIESMGEADISFCGRGGGMYDEHGKNILDCEATLLGKKLGLIWEAKYGEKVPADQSFVVSDGRGRTKKFAVKHPEMRDLFAVVLRDDTQGSQPYSLGNTVDLMNWRYPNDPEYVMRWASRLFDAVCAYGPFLKEERKTQCQPTVKALLYALDCVGKFQEPHTEYHPQARERLREWLAKRADGEYWQPLDLIDASALMMNKAYSDIYDWPLDVITAEVERQHEFHSVSAEEARQAELVDVKILIKDGAEERVKDRKIAMVASDDLDIHKYLMAADLDYYAVCVIKVNSKNQVQIFPGNFDREVRRGENIKIQQIPYNFPMRYIAAAMREAECKTRKIPVPSWPELVSDQGPKNERTWFFYSSTGWLMNGSLTMPDVEPTRISLGEILEIVRIGFDAQCAGYRETHINQLKLR